MNDVDFTPEQSLKLIASVISEAKAKFEEDGVVYIMWGLLVAAASFVQFFLLSNGYTSTHYYVWFVMPLGGLFSFFYYSRKRNSKKSRSHISQILTTLWITVGINIFIIGFGFASYLTEALIPMILLFIGIGIMVSGSILKFKLLFFSGLIMNVMGVIAFFVPYLYQILLLGIANIVCVFIPGLMIMRARKQNV